VVRSYYLVADFGASGSGRASIIPLSMGAPIPEDGCLMVTEGGETTALKVALEAIEALPGNQGLETRVALNPE
jgi:ABC-type thiamine transport system ATPase subunit